MHLKKNKNTISPFLRPGRHSEYLTEEKNLPGSEKKKRFRIQVEIAGARARARGAEPNVSRKALCARTIGVLGASGAAPEGAKIVRKIRDLQSRANQSPRKRADGTRL